MLSDERDQGRLPEVHADHRDRDPSSRPSEIPFTLLETPYYLEPIGKGDKVYALLREAMLEAGVIGIARVVMHTKEHLAALIPSGPRWCSTRSAGPTRSRPLDELKLPAEGGKTAAGLKAGELKMARQLIGDMTEPWKPRALRATRSATRSRRWWRKRATSRPDEAGRATGGRPPRPPRAMSWT